MSAPPSSSKPTILSTRSRRSSKNAPNSPSSRPDRSAQVVCYEYQFFQGRPTGCPFSLWHSQSCSPCASSKGLQDWLCHKRSEEHTSELQSHLNLVCRLLLEKKKK